MEEKGERTHPALASILKSSRRIARQFRRRNASLNRPVARNEGGGESSGVVRVLEASRVCAIIDESGGGRT